MEFKHIKGIDNRLADWLSRSFTFEDDTELPKKSVQNKSVFMIEKLKYKEKFSRWLKLKCAQIKECLIEKDRKELFTSLMLQMHKKLGHASYGKLIQLLKPEVETSSITAELKDRISKCSRCMHYKPHKRRYFTRFAEHLTAERPFEKISTDILGPINVSKFNHSFVSQKIYLITLTDIYSRYTEIYPVSTINKFKIKEAFEKWITKFEQPKYVLMDNGPQYTSDLVKNYLANKNIKAIYTPPYSPESNGISERINQKIITAINTYSGTSLEKCRKIIWNHLNIVVNRATGFSPCDLIGKTYSDVAQRGEAYKKQLEKTHKEYEKKMNKNIKNITKIKPGDKIFLKNEKKEKTDKNLKGPFRVIKTYESGKRIMYKDKYGRKCIGIRNVRALL